MAKIQTNDNGIIRTMKKMQANDGGVMRTLRKVQANNGGVIRTIFQDSTPLSAKNVGDSIFFWTGLPAAKREWIIVHKGKPSALYDDSFNNSVTVMMKDLYSGIQWGANNNNYANSDINYWLNFNFFNGVDDNISPKIKQVKIPYRPGSGTSTTVNSGANGLSVKVFLLSFKEAGGGSHANATTDGDVFGYFTGVLPNGNSEPKRVANLGAVATAYWSRSPNINAATTAWVVNSTGVIVSGPSSSPYAIRPCLVFPDTTLTDPSGNIV